MGIEPTLIHAIKIWMRAMQPLHLSECGQRSRSINLDVANEALSTSRELALISRMWCTIWTAPTDPSCTRVCRICQHCNIAALQRASAATFATLQALMGEDRGVEIDKENDAGFVLADPGEHDSSRRRVRILRPLSTTFCLSFKYRLQTEKICIRPGKTSTNNSS